MRLAPAALSALVLAAPTAPGPEEADPLAWLEEVEGERAIAWVRARNAETGAWAQGPAFDGRVARLREVLDARDKIPFVRKRGDYLYNFWRDREHPRGLWRRTTFGAYVTEPVDWEVVLDLDALGRAEHQSWVFAGATYLEPACDRAMVALSPGGQDAHVQREFDLVSKTFVAGGFALPASKSQIAWADRDTLLVAADFGPGTLTASGYPRTVRRWRRDTPLDAAAEVFAGEVTDVAVGASRDAKKGFARTFFSRSPTFFTSETYWLRPDGELSRLPLPDDAEPQAFGPWLLVRLRSAWSPAGEAGPAFEAGTLVVTPFAAFVSGGRAFTALFRPTPTRALASATPVGDQVVLNILDDVKNRLEVATFDADTGHWRLGPVPHVPAGMSLSVARVDDEGEDLFLTAEDHLTPTTLSRLAVGRAPQALKTMPAFFDAAGLAVAQFFATSADGTRVPYFQVGPRGPVPPGGARTLLYGYGGFEVSLVPHYSGTIGRGWLEAQGVFVVANIRGGGEYGPAWHEAAKQRHRHRAYEDFAAVAQDLVRRGITRPDRLGIMGGSNGGLLVGNMLTRSPELFGAAVCQVPLLDMLRYPHLLAGASWADEYGDPRDPGVWGWLRAYSPYHQLSPKVAYPPTLFLTSTRDDRVHPGHARKMMEKMRALGLPVAYYENIEGGHGGAADNAQAAYMSALAYTFLEARLPAPGRPDASALGRAKKSEAGR